jgi:hypothetical protein
MIKLMPHLHNDFSIGNKKEVTSEVLSESIRVFYFQRLDAPLSVSTNKYIGGKAWDDLWMFILEGQMTGLLTCSTILKQGVKGY